MKRQVYALGIILMSFSLSINSQVPNIYGDPHVAAKFATEAARNPQYVNLKSQLEALSRTATPRNTNAAAAKLLLTQNSSLLKSLYAKAEIDAPYGDGTANKRGIKKLISMNNSRLIYNPKWKPAISLTNIVTPPFNRKTIQNGSNNYKPDTSISNFGLGKTVIKYTGGQGSGDHLGLYANMFKQEFTVPNDPTIVGAEITFEFSYLYTGWDTYGSIYGLQILMRTDKLPDQVENNPMPVFNYQSGQYFPPYRIAGTIMPMDTIATEFGEFTSSGNDSSTVHRYVVPGESFSTEFGLVFPFFTKKGWYSSYHYAEMILKKVRVLYLKAQN